MTDTELDQLGDAAVDRLMIDTNRIKRQIEEFLAAAGQLRQRAQAANSLQELEAVRAALDEQKAAFDAYMREVEEPREIH